MDYTASPITGDVACNLRGGQALALTLLTGQKVFITVDAADEAAAAVNALRAAHRGQTPNQLGTEA